MSQEIPYSQQNEWEHEAPLYPAAEEGFIIYLKHKQILHDTTQ